MHGIGLGGQLKSNVVVQASLLSLGLSFIHWLQRQGLEVDFRLDHQVHWVVWRVCLG